MWLLSHRGADSASLFYYLFLAVLVCVHNVTAALRFNISPRHKLRFFFFFFCFVNLHLLFLQPFHAGEYLIFKTTCWLSRAASASAARGFVDSRGATWCFPSKSSVLISNLCCFQKCCGSAKQNFGRSSPCVAFQSLTVRKEHAAAGRDEGDLVRDAVRVAWQNKTTRLRSWNV